MSRPLLCAVLLEGLSSVYSTNYYISSGVAASGGGTSSSSPLKTVAEAVSRASSGDSVLLKRGDVFRESVAFTQGGIVIGAYGSGEPPVMSGGIAITGWTKQAGARPVYTATASSAVEYLFADNQFVWSARWPDTGFARVLGYTRTSTGYTIQSKQLTGNPRDAGGYWTGARVRWRRWDWWYEARTVTNYTTSGGTGILTVDGGSSYWNMATAPVGFYMDNKLSELDRANEWHINPSTRLVTLWAPDGKDPNTMSIEGSYREKALTVTNARI